MPISSAIYRDPDLRRVYAWGDVSRDDLRRQFVEGAKQAGYYPGIPTLIDLAHMQTSNLELPDIMALRDRIAERHTSAGTTYRAAMLAGSDTSFGMARIFETLCSDTEVMEIAVFRRHEDAFAFIGLSGTQLERTLMGRMTTRSA